MPTFSVTRRISVVETGNGHICHCFDIRSEEPGSEFFYVKSVMSATESANTTIVDQCIFHIYRKTGRVVMTRRIKSLDFSYFSLFFL